MRSWKRSISWIMSVIMLAGTLANSGFTVMAVDDDGPLVLKEGEEWVADDDDETPGPADDGE